MEFKVHHIHRKHAPLLHKKVFILCNEGTVLVAVHELGPMIKIHVIISQQTYVVASQKNRLTETVLVSTQNLY